MVKKKNLWWMLGIAGVTALAGALRIWGIGEMSLDVDEAITLSAAQGMVATGSPIIQASGLYYGRDILGTVTTAASIAIFGSSEWAARLPMVIFGIASVPLTYLLARLILVPRWWSIVAALAMAVSEWSIYYSRSARMYEEQQFFVLLTALLAVWTFQRWTWSRVGLTMLAAVLATLAHRSSVILFPILLILGLWHERSRVKGWFRPGTHRVWILLGMLMVSSLLTVAEVQFGWMSSVGKYILGTDKNPFEQIELKFVPLKHLWQTYPIWLIAFLGSWFWIKKIKGVAALLLLSWGVLISVDLFIYPSEPNYRTRYFYDMLPIFFVLACLSLNSLWERLRSSLKSRLLVIGMGAALGMVLFFEGMALNPTLVYADQPEWNRLKGVTAPVVIAHPTGPAHYYLGHVEYWLVTHKGEIRTYSEYHRDIYAGAEVLLDPNELQEILTTQHGVVVLESNRFDFISKKMLQTVREFATKDKDLSTDLLQVWRF